MHTYTHSSAFIVQVSLNDVCSGDTFHISWSYFIQLCICVYVKRNTLHQQHQQHINYVVCLPGGRQALGHVVCWRPQLQAAIPQQHLHGTSVAQGQHMRGRTHTNIKLAHHSKYWTKLKRTHLPFGYIFKKHLWPQKKAEGIIHTDSYPHKTAW